MKLAEILTGPETWCQGSFADEDDEHPQFFCLVGAVQELVAREHGGWAEMLPVLSLTDIFAAAQRILADVTYELHGHENPMAFNDRRSTTWDDIAAIIQEFDRRRMLENGETR